MNNKKTTTKRTKKNSDPFGFNNCWNWDKINKLEGEEKKIFLDIVEKMPNPKK